MRRPPSEGKTSQACSRLVQRPSGLAPLPSGPAECGRGDSRSASSAFRWSRSVRGGSTHRPASPGGSRRASSGAGRHAACVRARRGLSGRRIARARPAANPGSSAHRRSRASKRLAKRTAALRPSPLPRRPMHQRAFSRYARPRAATFSGATYGDRRAHTRTSLRTPTSRRLSSAPGLQMFSRCLR